VRPLRVIEHYTKARYGFFGLCVAGESGPSNDLSYRHVIAQMPAPDAT